MDIMLTTIVSGMTARTAPAQDGAELGPNADWSVVTYRIRGVESYDHAKRLIETSIILHSQTAPERNRFELDAAELGNGKVVHAGL